MKRLGTALVAIVIALGGCSTSNEAPRSQSESISNASGPSGTPTKETVSESPDEKFKKMVGGINVNHATANAQVVCSRLDKGNPPESVKAGAQENLGREDGERVYKAAITVYCPKHKAAL